MFPATIHNQSGKKLKSVLLCKDISIFACALLKSNLKINPAIGYDREGPPRSLFRDLEIISFNCGVFGKLLKV